VARSLGDRGLAGAESGSQRRFRFDPADAGNQKHWAGLWFGDNPEARLAQARRLRSFWKGSQIDAASDYCFDAIVSKKPASTQFLVLARSKTDRWPACRPPFMLARGAERT
jgi:hypothetical protein